MAHISHGVLGALFYLAIFNNFDLGQAGFSKWANSILNRGRSAIVLKIGPVPQDDGTSDSLISYRSRDAASYTPWVTSLNTFLNDYREPLAVPSRLGKVTNCDFNYPPSPGQFCDIDIRNHHPCIAENYFGYHRASPCVFFKLDTPPGWQPAFYNDTNSLPANMPSDLKNHIENIERQDARRLNTVWFSCEGENPADVEFIGPIQYLPLRGFPGYYLPNNGLDGYLSPLVAVAIQRPSSGILIGIKCKAWAHNIDHDSDQGVAKFGLLID